MQDVLALCDRTAVDGFQIFVRRGHAAVDADGAVRFDDDWTPYLTHALMNVSPRALWQLAKAGLIPVLEIEALRESMKAGRVIERLTPPVANVQHIDVEASTTLMLLCLSLSTSKTTAANLTAPASPRTLDLSESDED
jgi:hypothetical protein